LARHPQALSTPFIEQEAIMAKDKLTPAEKAAKTRAANKKKNDAKVSEAMIVARLSSAGFPAAQIEALRDLFEAA